MPDAEPEGQSAALADPEPEPDAEPDADADAEPDADALPDPHPSLVSRTLPPSSSPHAARTSIPTARPANHRFFTATLLVPAGRGRFEYGELRVAAG